MTGRGRRLLTGTAQAAVLLLFALALLLAFNGGGVDRWILGYRLRTNDPFKPLLGAAMALSVYLLAGGRVPGWLRALAAIVIELPSQIDALDRAAGRRRVTLIGATLTVLVTIAMTFDRPRTMPVHDSIQIFEVFYFFYSHVVTHHALPHWAPYGAFGVSFAPWSLIALTPASYLAAGVGWMLQLQDVLTVFTLSVCFELLLFAFGMAALLVRLELRPSVAWLTACLLVIGTEWSTQLWWNFRIVYMLPMVLFFLTRFLQEGRIQDVCLAGLAEVAGMIGNLTYFAPLHLLLVTAAGVALALRFRGWLHLTRGWLNWRAGLLALWAAASLAGWVVITKETMRPLVEPWGHAAGNMSVPIDQYLTWAINPSLDDTIRMLLRGWPLFLHVYPDTSFYFGPLTIFFAVWGLVHARRLFGFRLTAGLALGLFWLSFGGVFSLLLYFAPSFNVFRHLGLLLVAAGVFLVAAAAWGLEHFLAQARAKHVWYLLASIWVLFDAVVGSDQMMAGYRWWNGSPLTGPESAQLVRAVAVSALLIVVLAAVSRLRRWPWHQPLGGLAWLVAVAWLVGLAMFANFRSVHLPSLSPAQETEFHAVLQVRAPAYSERMTTPDEITAVAQNLLEFARSSLKPLRTTAYGSFDLWSGRDACRSPGLDTFVPQTTRDAFDGPHRPVDPMLDAIFKCEGPKLRLVPLAGQVTVEQFTANTLSATVQADGPGVLVYADAIAPDWHVRVDGADRPIQAAFGAFKSVALESGAHRVEFQFEPAFGLTAVEWLTLSSAVFVLMLLAMAVKAVR